MLFRSDVFRLNFSHGDHAGHKANVDTIRALEKSHGRPISVLADMQGPKLRVGAMPDSGVVLTAGEPFTLELGDGEGDARRAYLPHPEIFAALKEETRILLDDGKIRLRVDSVEKDRAKTTVLAGGRLTSRKGVNVPNAVLPLASLTKKDHTDLEFALRAGVDWIALSFVQRPSDIVEARELIGTRAGVLSKIEKPAALQQLADVRRRVRRQGAEVGLALEDGHDQVAERIALERALPRQALVEHAPERPDVGARIRFGAANLFGSHVGRRADQRSLDRQRRRLLGWRGVRIGPLANPEVQDLDEIVDAAAVGQ